MPTIDISQFPLHDYAHARFDGKEYPSQIINITRATDEKTVVYTEAQTLEAGEITHLTIEHIPCNEIQSGPVLLYLTME